ncbi:alpha/beta-hydrolase [Xylariaceae sp. FL0594]|nr:alpha/beta-hydrolase [Xylariaceae sp. FL0594]
MDSFERCLSLPSGQSSTAAVTTAVAITLALVSLTRLALWPRKRVIIRGALTTTIPKLSAEEIAKIAYRPDDFPGARDVDTPYGSIRVYEYGPDEGRKVLLIHGISTSCMTLKVIADGLVAKGCRVLMFDLFGRGYSDAPGDLPYDTRLFVTQALLALASSPLAWTGEGAGLGVVGYSLGGGIAASFAATFPHLVETLVLLAPAGMIRPANIGRASRLVFTSGLVPERLLAWMTKRRLRTPIDNAVQKRRGRPYAAAATVAASSRDGRVQPLTPIEEEEIDKEEEQGQGQEQEQEDLVDVAVQEAVDPPSSSLTGPTPFELEVTSFVHWSIDHNAGFVPAMMSTIRHGPLMGQHDCWRKLAKRKPGTTAILMGENDTLVQHEDYEEDALPLVGGRGNVFWRIVPGGHNFPFTHPRSTLKTLCEFWGLD